MLLYCLSCEVWIDESLMRMLREWKRKRLGRKRKVFDCAIVLKMVCDDRQDL